MGLVNGAKINMIKVLTTKGVHFQFTFKRIKYRHNYSKSGWWSEDYYTSSVEQLSLSGTFKDHSNKALSRNDLII